MRQRRCWNGSPVITFVAASLLTLATITPAWATRVTTSLIPTGKAVGPPVTEDIKVYQVKIEKGAVLLQEEP